MSDTIGIWQKDPRAWATPGGDPVYYCPHCGEGLHVYGIEHRNNHMDKCPDCGKKNKYPWEISNEGENKS